MLGEFFGLFLLFQQGSSWQMVQPARTANLEWDRGVMAARCTDREALERAVESRLRRTVFVDAARAEVLVKGHVDRSANGKQWSVQITMVGATGELLGTRTLQLEQERCDAITPTVALVVAVMLDPDPSTLPPEPSPPPTVPFQRSWTMQGDLAVSFGFAPRAGFGVGLTLAMNLSAHFALSLRGDYDLERSVSVASRAISTFSLQSLTLGACPWPGQRGRLAGRVCLLASGARLAVNSSGFDQVENHTQWVPSLGLGGQISWAFTPSLGLFAAAQGEVPLSRPSFFYRDLQTMVTAQIFRVSPMAGRLFAGLSLRWH